MTKDDDFKRIVRRQARESGERYSEARARLEDARSGHHGDGWVILWTVPGAEEQVRRWLMQRQALGVVEVLVPRFKQRKFAPGMLLVRIGEEADVSALASQVWVTGFCRDKCSGRGVVGGRASRADDAGPSDGSKAQGGRMADTADAPRT